MKSSYLILAKTGNLLSVSGFQPCQDFDVQFSALSDKPIKDILYKTYA